MPDRGAIHDVVGRYVAALDARDAEAVTGLFTEDAVHDNPMSSGRDVGPAHIREFYEQTFSVPMTAAMDGPTTIHGDDVAFRVVIEIPAGRTPFRLLISYLGEVATGPDGVRFRTLRAVPDSVALNG